MAYLGSTQLSSVANPPVFMFGTNSAMDARIPGSGTTGSTIYVNNAWKSGSTVSYNEGRAFGGQVWGYWTTDNTTAVMSTAGYFTDAGPLGMRPGDIVMVVGCGSTVGSSTVLRIGCIAAITTGGTAFWTSASLATAT